MKAETRSRQRQGWSSAVRTRPAVAILSAASVTATISAAAMLAVGVGTAYAKGGTAKPPGGGGTTTTLVPQINVTPPAAGSGLPGAQPLPPSVTPAATTAGFDVTGFIQSATVDSGTMCATAAPSQRGGTVIVNGLTITVPCHTTLQFPAASFTWADMFTEAPTALTLDGTLGSGTLRFPSIEISVAGNIVDGEYRAGLITISQQPLNQGSGFIKSIDYVNGALIISGSPTGPDMARIEINDPDGKYSQNNSLRAAISPSHDIRFSVDTENPTITAASGYPMCIPRTDPSITDDPECPMKNRPKPGGPTGCRTFATAGVTSPSGWELSGATTSTGHCTAFVMKAPLGSLPVSAPAAISPSGGTVLNDSITVVAAQIATSAADADSRKQVPFVVGDFINYTGTQIVSDGSAATKTISVHTIQANVGAFTQPGSLPAYIWIEETIIGADAVAVGAGLPPLEGQDRLVVIGRTTDVRTPVDLYFIDENPAYIEASTAPTTSWKSANRWVTMEAMTGGITPGSQPFGGGITTQLIGPQPGRVRARGPKAPPGILVSPTRLVRMVTRSLCAPAANTGSTATGGKLGTYFDINLGGAPVPTGLPGAGSNTQCLLRAKAANGLYTGQYAAPVGEYIFPENVVAGDRLVPFNFWNLDFLYSGEGSTSGSPKQLTPTPW
jgi:hypothetical protein